MPHVDNNLIFYLIYVTVKDKIEIVSYYFLNLYYAHRHWKYQRVFDQWDNVNISLDKLKSESSL
jgi:hypothetical protein